MAHYIPIPIGSKYGCYTVIEKSDKVGSQEFYKVRCDCGAVYEIGKIQLRNKPTRCKSCAGKSYTAMMLEKRKERIGQIINGFRIIAVVPSEDTVGEAKFITECVIYGHRCEKTLSAMRYKKGDRCLACPPNYNFLVDGDVVIGHLSNGTEFKIDAEDIEIVANQHWYINGGGYLFHRDSGTRTPYRMHRVILGLEQGDNTVVDHLNHDKLDNRKCNLSIGTQADNCRNNIKKCSNTIGHIGVQIAQNGLNFTSVIESEGCTYPLITTPSIEDAAQAYNVAADYIFGVGIGYRNQVLYPSQDFACSIIEKIKAIQNAETVKG